MDTPDLVPPGFWGSSIDNIHVLDGFVQNDELKILSQYAKKVSDWTGNDSDLRYKDRIHLNIEDSVKHIFSLLFSRMGDAIKQNFPVEIIPEGYSICRWMKGDSMPPHADKQELDGSPNCQPEHDIASVIYINGGSEFEGGEIYFPNQSLEIKPQAGMGIFFPGDINYLHGVKSVTNGTRYTIPFFWKVVCVK